MNVGIVGSRSLARHLERMLKIIPEYVKEGDVIVSGGATAGGDEAAQEFARRRGRTIIIHYPAWKEFGKQAGFIRNVKIVDDSDLIVAFWDGKSEGTKHTIAQARKKKVPTVVLVMDTESGDFSEIEVD